MLSIKGRMVRINWGEERKGIILDVKEVPESCEKIENIGKLITPAHNEFLVGFPSGYKDWFTVREIRIIS